MKRPNRSSPVPLYHQIALELRRQIEDGSMPPGAALEPIREAAERLGVNLHTVRHAYAELAREGWVESRRSQGTRVLARGNPTPQRAPDELETEVLAFCERIGLTPRELRERLEGWLRPEGAPPPKLHVVECSSKQASDLAAQLEEHFHVAANPWSLSREGRPEGGNIVATFFHYNEVRRRWPDQLHGVRFLTIRPDPKLAGALAPDGDRKRRKVRLCELDDPTWEAVAADLSLVLPTERFEVERAVVEDPGSLLRSRARTPVLYTPRTWSQLTPAEREHPRTVLVRYVFDPTELEELGHDLELRPKLAQPT